MPAALGLLDRLLARLRPPAPTSAQEAARALARRAPCQILLHGPDAAAHLRDALDLRPASRVLCLAGAASTLGRAADAHGAPVIRSDRGGDAFDPVWGLLAAWREAGPQAAEQHAMHLAHALIQEPPPAATDYWVANTRHMIAVALLDATVPRSGHERMAMAASEAGQSRPHTGMHRVIELLDPPPIATIQDMMAEAARRLAESGSGFARIAGHLAGHTPPSLAPMQSFALHVLEPWRRRVEGKVNTETTPVLPRLAAGLTPSWVRVDPPDSPWPGFPAAVVLDLAIRCRACGATPVTVAIDLDALPALPRVLPEHLWTHPGIRLAYAGHAPIADRLPYAIHIAASGRT